VSLSSFVGIDLQLIYSTVTAAKLLAFAELVLDPKTYSTLEADGSEVLSTIVEVIVGRRWIEDLTIAIEKLITASVSLYVPKEANE